MGRIRKVNEKGLIGPERKTQEDNKKSESVLRPRILLL